MRKWNVVLRYVLALALIGYFTVGTGGCAEKDKPAVKAAEESPAPAAKGGPAAKCEGDKAGCGKCPKAAGAAKCQGKAEGQAKCEPGCTKPCCAKK